VLQQLIGSDIPQFDGMVTAATGNTSTIWMEGNRIHNAENT